MPHLKIKPFETKNLEKLPSLDSSFLFCAKRENDFLIAIKIQNNSFFINLKRADETYLLKYEKVTRPLNLIIIKEALLKIVTLLNLEIISSNIHNIKENKKISTTFLKTPKEFENISYPKEKVSIEVGFGSGRHLLYQANQNRDTLFIGIEIHTPSAQQVLKQINLQNLTNIWIVNYDARLFFEMLSSNLCSNIFVHFPVPWDKQPLRRVINRAFIEEAIRILKKDGVLELRTDSDNYFDYSKELFSTTPFTKLDILINREKEVISKYEERWLKKEKNIYNLSLTSLKESLIKTDIIDFNFDKIKYHNNIKLPKKAILFEDYFIHFERIYTVSSKKTLLLCAFGSFNRPERKYIYIDENFCSYFSSKPIKTDTNLKAHQELIKHLK